MSPVDASSGSATAGRRRGAREHRKRFHTTVQQMPLQLEERQTECGLHQPGAGSDTGRSELGTAGECFDLSTAYSLRAIDKNVE